MSDFKLKHGFDMKDKALLEPYLYVCEVPGKQIRTKLAQALNVWMKVPEDKLKEIGQITEMLHNSSLLLDDIEDGSTLRRGVPVAHHIYGLPMTINCANFVHRLAIQRVLKLNHPDAAKIYADQVVELHRGQGLDIYWRDSQQCPTEQEYKNMVLKKTGGLFCMATGFMQLFSDNKMNFQPLLENLGLYFQIRDDYANLISKEYEKSKTFCEDLTEGKFSFPIIHGINSDKGDKRILTILQRKTTDVDVKKYCVELLETKGSLEYTRATLVNLENTIYAQIEELGGNRYMKGIMDELRKVYTPCLKEKKCS